MKLKLEDLIRYMNWTAQGLPVPKNRDEEQAIKLIKEFTYKKYNILNPNLTNEDRENYIEDRSDLDKFVLNNVFLAVKLGVAGNIQAIQYVDRAKGDFLATKPAWHLLAARLPLISQFDLIRDHEF